MILIGQILKPQGVKGEIKVKGFVDSPCDFKNFKRVFIDNIETKILSCRVIGEEVFLYIEKVFDREEAEKLRGKELFLPKEELNLGDGRFLISDCIGCELWLNDEAAGKKLGILTDIFAEYATEIYVAKQENGTTVSFPNIPKLIEEFDLKNKKIFLNSKIFSEVACFDD